MRSLLHYIENAAHFYPEKYVHIIYEITKKKNRINNYVWNEITFLQRFHYCQLYGSCYRDVLTLWKIQSEGTGDEKLI